MSYLTGHWSFDPFLVVVAVLVIWHETGLARLARRSRPERTGERRRRMPEVSQALALVGTNLTMWVLAMSMSLFTQASWYPVTTSPGDHPAGVPGPADRRRDLVGVRRRLGHPRAGHGDAPDHRRRRRRRRGDRQDPRPRHGAVLMGRRGGLAAGPGIGEDIADE